MNVSQFPTQRENKKISSKKIVSANLFSRTVAFIVDLVFVVFVAGIVFSLLQMLFLQFPNVQNIQNKYASYYLESGLFKEDDETNAFVVLEYDNYKGYEEAIHKYYTDYKVNNCPEQYRDDKYTTYWYNVHIYGLYDGLGLYTAEDLSNREQFITETGPTLFEYKLDSNDEILYNEIAAPKTDANQDALLDYYYISDEENTEKKSYVYLVAAKDLFTTPYFSDTLDEIQLWINYIPIFISAILSSLVFLFIIPMITKYGRTLGKMMFGLAVVNKLGYDIKKTQLLPRFFFPVLVFIFAFFVCQLIGNVLMSFMLFTTLFTLVSYCMVIFTKDHKAIHDYFALTLVIDAKQSIWYKNANEEEKVNASVKAGTKTVLEDEIEGKNLLYVNPTATNDSEENPIPKDDD